MPLLLFSSCSHPKNRAGRINKDWNLVIGNFCFVVRGSWIWFFVFVFVGFFFVVFLWCGGRSSLFFWL